MKRNIRNLIKYIIPSIFTNACVFLLSIIDGIFVGRGISTDAVGAINLLWPFIMINYGINVLTSIGGVTITAIRFGRKDYKGANVSFMTSLFLTLIFSLAFSLTGTLFTKEISSLLGAKGVYLNLVMTYLFWYSIFIVPAAISVSLQHFCRNDGDPYLVTFTSIVSTITNIVLDYYFIFIVKAGIGGAAFATGLSQLISLGIISIHYINRKGFLRIQIVRIRTNLIEKILIRGFPDMIAQFSIPTITYCMNLVVLPYYGDIGLNSFGIINYISSLTLAVLYGVSEGVQPLFGRSFGAKRFIDLKFYFYSSLFITFTGSIIVVLLCNLNVNSLTSLFGSNEETNRFIIENLPKFSWGFIIAAINAIIASFLYSTQKSKEATLFNFLRCILISSICILFLPKLLGENIIWFSYGISEVLVMIIGIIMIYHSENEILFPNNSIIGE